MNSVCPSLLLALFVFPIALTLASLSARPAHAGVFNTSRFVEPDSFAVGLEPEMDFSDPVGMSGNLKVTQGTSEMTNVSIFGGTGSGSRQFRAGLGMSFDPFPDSENQPGIGIAAQAVYYRTYDRLAAVGGLAGPMSSSSRGQFDLIATPFLHKTFVRKGSEISPFLALPIGLTFDRGESKRVTTLSFGALFGKPSSKLRFVTEFGIAVSNSKSYFGGGIAYYP